VFKMKRFCQVSSRVSRLARPFLAIIVVATAQWIATGEASAAVYELFNKGRIEGERVATEVIDGKTFHVFKLTNGVVIRLSSEKVRGELKKSEAELWYEAWLPKIEDSVDGHLTMSRECGERSLNFQRDHHLLQVIRIDPENETARRGLGFGQIDGKWVRVDIFRRQNGYIRHKGKWWVEQDLAIEREKEEIEQQNAEWSKKIRLLKKIAQGGSDKAGAAMNELRSIRDPMAVKTMAEFAANKKEPFRRVFMKNLAEIGTPPAISPLVNLVLLENNNEIREYAIDLVGESNSSWAARALTAGLKSKSNPVVLRAAKALALLRDPNVIPELIDAIHTKHTVTRGSGGNLNLGFSNGGTGGFNAGGGAKAEEVIAENVLVRDALVAITGRNYGYSETKWKNWYQMTKSPHLGSLRRSP
jgi:hypothetical protein